MYHINNLTKADRLDNGMVVIRHKACSGEVLITLTDAEWNSFVTAMAERTVTGETDEKVEADKKDAETRKYIPAWVQEQREEIQIERGVTRQIMKGHCKLFGFLPKRRKLAKQIERRDSFLIGRLNQLMRVNEAYRKEEI